jgi:hypothetical protein
VCLHMIILIVVVAQVPIFFSLAKCGEENIVHIVTVLCDL